MVDLLTNALNKANAKALGVASNLQDSSASKSIDAINTQRDNLNNILNDLPTDVDPELLIRQQEARALEIKAKIQQDALVKKDEAIEQGKAIISNLKGKLISSLLPKLPTVDPKILQGIALARQIKKLYEERSKLSRENLSKGKELYSYPMQEIVPIDIDNFSDSVPSVPQVQIPNLPLRR
jgi:hypothetical protein